MNCVAHFLNASFFFHLSAPSVHLLIYTPLPKITMAESKPTAELRSLMSVEFEAVKSPMNPAMSPERLYVNLNGPSTSYARRGRKGTS